MNDVFDIDWESLSYGELCVFEEQLKGEFKRRKFPESASSRSSPDKQIVSIALALRVYSQGLRKLAREYKPAKAKSTPLSTEEPHS